LNYVALKPITEVRGFVEVGASINSQCWLDTAVGALYQYKFCMSQWRTQWQWFPDGQI